MTLTLYHSPGTRSIRPLWLMEEMGVDYQLESIDYDSTYFASETFRSINPMGKVPALIEDGQLLIESTAIMQYLLQTRGPSPLAAQPTEPEYATYLQWFHMAESGMANYVAVSFGHSFDMDPYRVSPEFDTYCRYQIEKAVAMLEDHLKGREYLLERGFTAADISLGYTLLFAKFCIQLDMQGRVADYYHRLMARPCLQKALADFPVKNPADPA